MNLTFPTVKHLLTLQLLAAFAALLLAFVAQYGFLLHPCDLCWLQRYPYMAVMAVALIGRLWVPVRGLVLLCAALFLLDAGIAFYHAGVELDIFKGPDACSSQGGGEKTLEEMRAEIMNAPLVSCKQATAYFLGVSMAMWNGLYATVMFVLSIVGWRRVKNPAR